MNDDFILKSIPATLPDNAGFISYNEHTKTLWLNSSNKLECLNARFYTDTNENSTIVYFFHGVIKYKLKSLDFNLLDVFACLVDMQQFFYISFFDYCLMLKKDVKNIDHLSYYISILQSVVKIKRFLGDFDTSEIRTNYENRIELFIE